MDIRRVILFVVLIWVDHAAAGTSRLTKVLEMLTDLQDHVTSLEEQQAEMRNYMNAKLMWCQQTNAELPVFANQHPITPPSITDLPSDCSSFSRRLTQDSVKNINAGGQRLRVLCDAAGSIVLMKRFDGSLPFNRLLQEYSDGFGDLKGEFWTGLNDIRRITSSGRWTLRFDLEDFDGTTVFAEYSGFTVGPGPDFSLIFDQNSYNGTAGDSLGLHRGQRFSTLDRDVDKSADRHCAERYDSGWWYSDCINVQITRMPYGDRGSMYWGTWKSGFKAATMSIKRIE